MPQNCYIVTIGSLTQHIYPAWKTILTIWQNMKAKEKIPITQLLSEPGKTLKYSKIPIFNLFMNWEKLGSTAHVKSPTFESID